MTISGSKKDGRPTKQHHSRMAPAANPRRLMACRDVIVPKVIDDRSAPSDLLYSKIRSHDCNFAKKYDKRAGYIYS